MQTIGERLEEARKKKGISIREAAEATKIRGDYLSKFESNQFDINLTELYVRGFLRTYANFLRLPSDRILNDYAALGHNDAKPRQPSREIYGRMDVSISSSDEERAEKSTIVPEEPAPAVPQPSHRNAGPNRHPSAGSGGSAIDPALVFKVLKWAGVVVVALLLVWVGKAVFSSSGAPAAKPAPSTAATTPAPSQVAAQPVPEGETITLIALDVVRVSVERKNPDKSHGEVVFQGTLVRGQNQVVAKPGPVYITVSAAENLEIEVRGKRYPTNFRGYQTLQIL